MLTLSKSEKARRLKDTRTNNQPQILFTHHLRSPNYPKTLQRTSLSLAAHVLPCTRVHVHSTCLLKRHSLAAWLFACSLQIVIVVRYFGQISQIEHAIICQYLPYFGAPPPSPPPHYLSFLACIRASIVSHSFDLSWHRWKVLSDPNLFLGFVSFCLHANRNLTILQVRKRTRQKHTYSACGQEREHAFCVSSFVSCVCSYVLVRASAD